ncbi:MAG TPA: transposase [Terriglobales bacterium]|jgi:putative transposase|nr:transposase [Terriglobales bacterium]
MAIPIRHSDPCRISAGARTFFVTSSTWGKRSLLQSERAASLLVEVLYEYRKQGKYLLHEFVIMPDHFHILMTVGPELSIERAVQFVKGGFAFRVGKQLGLKAPVWQRGFSEVRVRTVAQFAGIRNYIRENPVTRHLTEHSNEFLYSSAHAGFDLDPPPQGLKPKLEEIPVGTPEGVP